MKLAITGGTGFIGAWVLRSIDQNTEVKVFGRDKKRKSVITDTREYEYVITDYSVGDLTEKLKGYDALIHLAATRVGASGFEPYLENIAISQNLFEACNANGISNVVCLSSISVYSFNNTQPWKEDSYVAPLTFYGISKVSMENLAEYYNCKKSMSIKSLRVAQVLGHGERSGFMLMNFIEQAYNNEILHVYGEGAGRREYVYVRDVVDAIFHALHKADVKGIFNIGTGVNTSHYELAETINAVFQNGSGIQLVKNIVEDKGIYVMDLQKTEKELGWLSKWTLEDGLKEVRELMMQDSNRRVNNV